MMRWSAVPLVRPLAFLAAAACMRSADVDPGAQDGTARTEVLTRLAAYTAAARAVDADASAAFFAPGGTLFEPGIPPIVTPDSIRAFIKSFPGVEVDSAVAHADTVELHGGTAYVWGSYFEALRFPGQPASAQHGRFVMEWVRGEDAVWRILRYYRVPLPANWPPAP
jgi:ketosteroid isomerase-like protein